MGGRRGSDMKASALLAELDAAGIHLTREDDNLRVRAERGVSLAPYLERIKANKPALLRELLQRQIVAALDVEPAIFNRIEYDRFWTVWHAENAKEASTP